MNIVSPTIDLSMSEPGLRACAGRLEAWGRSVSVRSISSGRSGAKLWCWGQGGVRARWRCCGARAFTSDGAGDTPAASATSGGACARRVLRRTKEGAGGLHQRCALEGQKRIERREGQEKGARTGHLGRRRHRGPVFRSGLRAKADDAASVKVWKAARAQHSRLHSRRRRRRYSRGEENAPR